MVRLGLVVLLLSACHEQAAGVTKRPADADGAAVVDARPPAIEVIPRLPDVAPEAGDPDVALVDMNTGPCPIPDASLIGDRSLVWVDAQALGPGPIADRLVRWLFRSGPAPDVTALVAGCRPFTAAHVRALADALLRDERARPGLTAQFETWLWRESTISRALADPRVFPELTAGLLASMKSEVGLTGARAVLDDKSLSELFTSREAVVDGRLAAHYHLPGIAPDAPFAPVTFSQLSERAGLLNSAAVASYGMRQTRHSPVLRGRFLLERLLCIEAPPPPLGLMIPNIPAVTPGKSLRQAFEAGIAQPICAGCHRLMDVGWALEGFDALGRERGMDNGFPIDARAQLASVVDMPATVTGARELGFALEKLPEARDCFVDHMFAIANGFDVPIPNRLTSPTTPLLRGRFTRSGGKLRELLLDIASTADFYGQRR
jgi:hypothetical protein